MTVKTPMSAAGTESSRGFTLIELIVALALGGLLVALLPPQLSRLMDGVRYRVAVQDAMRTLERTRMAAVSTGRRTYMSVDVKTGQLLSNGRVELTLPDTVELAVTGVADLGQELPSVYFDADGSASGGRLSLVSSGRESVIELDWLTGQIQVNGTP
ncbi:MAG TPA: prepilin-type N-terminal cleavage/methylation domain-containing protein [Burkholderiaceae bacterium]|nr:prepilin-type N-terminal cleavage/methylation domain-containing protein [Burkholderiaceae bacterium]